MLLTENAKYQYSITNQPGYDLHSCALGASVVSFASSGIDKHLRYRAKHDYIKLPTWFASFQEEEKIKRNVVTLFPELIGTLFRLFSNARGPKATNQMPHCCPLLLQAIQ